MDSSSMAIVAEGTEFVAVYTENVYQAWRFHNNGPATVQLSNNYSTASGGTATFGPKAIHPGNYIDIFGESVLLNVEVGQIHNCAVVEWELRTT